MLLPGAVFYLSTAPNVCLVDAGALTLAAAGPGVAHPAGFPLWTMLGWLSTQFPGSEIRNTTRRPAVRPLARTAVSIPHTRTHRSGSRGRWRLLLLRSCKLRSCKKFFQA